MSLKAFHIVFIVVSVLMALGVAGWELRAYQQGGQTMDLILGLGFAVVGAVLLVYGRYFLKKLKDISYL